MHLLRTTDKSTLGTALKTVTCPWAAPTAPRHALTDSTIHVQYYNNGSNRWRKIEMGRTGKGAETARTGIAGAGRGWRWRGNVVSHGLCGEAGTAPVPLPHLSRHCRHSPTIELTSLHHFITYGCKEIIDTPCHPCLSSSLILVVCARSSTVQKEREKKLI